MNQAQVQELQSLYNQREILQDAVKHYKENEEVENEYLCFGREFYPLGTHNKFTIRLDRHSILDILETLLTNNGHNIVNLGGCLG